MIYIFLILLCYLSNLQDLKKKVDGRSIDGILFPDVSFEWNTVN